MAIMKFENCHAIAGFPGIGKSTVTKKYAGMKGFKLIDFDSAVFKANMDCTVKEYNLTTGEFEVIDNFAYAYVREIHRIMEAHEKRIRNGECKAIPLFILCSTHSDVLKQLDIQEIPHTIVIPGASVTAKDKYVERLKARYEESVKNGDSEVTQNGNKMALDAVSKNYYTFVNGIRNNCVSKYGCVAVLGDNEYFEDFFITITIGMPHMLCGVENTINATKRERMTRLMDYFDICNFTMGSHGEIIFWSNPLIRSSGDRETIEQIMHTVPRLIRGQSENSAFAGCPYIMLRKDVAQGVLDCLNSAIERLSADGSDIEAFGDNAIHYERLIDALDGLNYLYYGIKQVEVEIEKEREMRKENSSNNTNVLLQYKGGPASCVAVDAADSVKTD